METFGKEARLSAFSFVFTFFVKKIFDLYTLKCLGCIILFRIFLLGLFLLKILFTNRRIFYNFLILFVLLAFLPGIVLSLLSISLIKRNVSCLCDRANSTSTVLSVIMVTKTFDYMIVQVVVMTHAYGNRSGVRYMTGGLKVYYVPWRPFFLQNTLPTFYGTLSIVRTILIRERISLVHGHQAFSTLCHEALMHARTMGYKVVFTDHSLYGFADVGSIHMNKVLQFTLADVSQAICVSHTSKENTVLRSGLPPEKVFVIPNAVDTAMFKPASERLNGNEIVIVVISRLVYRKGADLLVEVIPEVCRLYPNVRFIVGGDGPKRVRLEEMREKHSLQDQVEMLGAVPHAQVRSVLISGHIFLNSSLTEAFCIAILEAASCGLLTVSTRVGGVPEVLPDDMIVLAEPDPSDMVQAIRKAISILPNIDPQVMHFRMKELYSWHDVAKRTKIVYDRALKCSNQNLLERLGRYLSCGAWAGKLFCLVMIIDFLIWRLLQLWQPAEDIEEVPNINLPSHHGKILQEINDNHSS